MKKFCDIQSRDDLADFLKIKRSHLTYVLYKKKTDSFYRSFQIPKKTGGNRQIHASVDELKIIQSRLANRLWEYQKAIRTERNIRQNISHAFEKKKNIITNAHIHRNKYLVLNLDLEHFFESIHFGRVVGYFEKNKDFSLPHDVAIILAQLTCHEGHLPQGAPSSPIITNLICHILDMRILKIAKRYKLDYTRYADDMTFSTNDRAFTERKEAFMHDIESEICKSGFTINHQKTRMSLRDSKQKVTGLVVNQKANVDSDYYKQTRAMAHHLYSKGCFEIDGTEGTIAQLDGRFSFIDQLDHYNNKIDGKKHGFWHFSSRENQFKRFLFYRYFYANSKPLIVTEGKTDIRYLKAALKKLYLEYPNLITKDAHGKFCYKISFLRKSKRLSYFLNVNSDGADTLKNIFNYYVGGIEGFPNYYAMFSKLDGSSPKHPVILLFDNEQITGKRPLSKFLIHDKINKAEKDALKKQLYTRLAQNSNLYLATNPLVDDMPECEIEFLFDQATREYQLEGKVLCLKDEYDINRCYGKEIFSRYVSQNYAQIDFGRFRELLNVLSDIVKQY
ncbi:retron Ec67 family RNA-directed DNA polymerase/endonuclease [Bacillota bacterium Meth-B3]